MDDQGLKIDPCGVQTSSRKLISFKREALDSLLLICRKYPKKYLYNTYIILRLIKASDKALKDVKGQKSRRVC